MLMEYRAGPMDQLAESGHSIDGLGMLGFPCEIKIQHMSPHINRNSRSIKEKQEMHNPEAFRIQHNFFTTSGNGMGS